MTVSEELNLAAERPSTVEALELIARDNAALTENLLEVVRNLIASQSECLDMIDDLHSEVARVSAGLAALRRKSLGGWLTTAN